MDTKLLKQSDLKNIISITLGVLFGVYFTYFLVQKQFISPVFASSFCGLIGACFFLKKIKNTDLGIAIYCGSFAGMGSVFDGGELVITSFIVVLLILLSMSIFKGFGGKLGFIAYISSIVSEIIIVILGSKKMEDFSLLNTFTSFNPITENSVILSVIIASILGFYLTVYFHHGLKKSAVFSSAFPSCIVALVVYYSGLPNGGLIAVTFFSASFVGMVAEDLLKSKHFPPLVLVHFLTIILFKKNLGNYGGALGTIAFFSVFLLIQFDLVIEKYFKKN